MRGSQYSSYEELRQDILACYFRFCAERALGLGWDMSEVLASVSETFESARESLIEQVMREVILGILGGAWQVEFLKSSRQEILRVMGDARIHDLIGELTFDDSEEFMRDYEWLMEKGLGS